MTGGVKGATDNYARLVEIAMKGSKKPEPLQRPYSENNPTVLNKKPYDKTFDVGSYVSEIVGTGKGQVLDIKA